MRYRQDLKLQIEGILKKPFSFRYAWAASVVFHFLFLLAGSLILSLFESSPFHKPPLVFDFAFFPVDEFDPSSSRADFRKITDELKANLPPESKASEPRVPHRQNLASQIEQLAEPVDKSAESEAKAENKASVREKLASTLEPTLLLRPKIISDRPRQVSIKIPMNRKQQKMLRKKFKKWAQDFNKMHLPDSTLVWQHKGTEYTAKFVHEAAKTSMDIDALVIEISTEDNGTKLTSELRMKRLAFSHFAQFIDYWDPAVAIHDDVLEGRFHSNTKISLLNSRGVKPKFQGKVTTASYDIHISQSGFPYLDQKDVFLGGLETGVKAIRLPKKFLPLSNDSTISESNIHTFQEETWITFRGEGGYTWKIDSPQNEEHRQNYSEQPYFIIGSKKKKLHLKGVLRGKVLVYSPGKIIIDGDITYTRHPEISFTAEDYLGIVSDKDVEIAHPSVTGPGDLNIFAAIYAKGRFRVRHRSGKRGATLFIYGSLTAGSLSATEPRYATRIRTDKRLEDQRPPNFPMTDRYEMLDWDGQWQLKANE